LGLQLYICMIESITHKGLRLLWERGDPSKLPPEQVMKISRILETLDTAKTLNPLKAIPGYKLHALSGNLKGFWSVWVTGNYRIVFRLKNENVFDVDYIDYH
jgi:proteic killer suppression protein